MGIMWRLLGERKVLFGTNLGLRLIKDMLPFMGPILVGLLIDVLTGTDRSLLGFDFDGLDRRALLILAGLMALLAVLKMFIGYIHTMVAAHMGRHVVEAARRDLANAAMQMALDERRRFNSGDLLDRCLADSKGLRSFTQNVIIRVISNTVRAVWPLLYMFMMDWVMALVVLAVIPLQSTLSAMLQHRLQRQSRTARKAEASHTAAVKEAIDGWSSVASVGGQDWVASELRSTASSSEDAKIAKKRTTAAISAVISFCTALGIAVCYAIGGMRVLDHATAISAGEVASGVLTVGELSSFIGIAKKVYAPFQAYTKIVNSYRTGLVNLERISEVLDAPMIDPRPDGPELVVTSGDITLDHVGFTYQDDEAPVLQSLTGRIPGRTLTVITGSSGAGKTTLLRLLMGHDQPAHGSIAIDGQDINKARLASVQRVMALVPQEPMLFTGTLGENLTLGLTDADTNDLLDACHRAGLLELVRDLPQGLDTEVGSGRHMLSGGQLRRMAIARALLRNPSILMLDEPTAGLDDLHSKQVLETLRRIATSATVLMVSHRKDPLLASDHHLVLQDGTWKDGHGQGDRWRPEGVDRITEPAPSQAEAAADQGLLETIGQNGNGHHGSDDSPADGEDRVDSPALVASSANGHSTNGEADLAAANGSPGRMTVGQAMVDLSAMGRPISMAYIDRTKPTSRVLVAGNHRAEAMTSPAVIEGLLRGTAADPLANIAVAAIPTVNPDGAFTEDGRSVLGIDLVGDHGNRLARETSVLQQATRSWKPNLVFDIGERASTTRPNADIEVTIRFTPGDDNTGPDWLAQLGSDIRRRLAASAFSVNVSLVAAESTSLTANTGIPVVEITAVSPPHLIDSHLSQQSLIEASLAACQAAALVSPTPIPGARGRLGPVAAGAGAEPRGALDGFAAADRGQAEFGLAP